MAKICQLIEKFEEWAPLTYAADWDNSGWQIFLEDCETETVTVALSLSEKVIQQALEYQSKLIVTHHPLFFKPIKSIIRTTYPGLFVQQLITEGISLYSAHTSLDVIPNGISDYLAQKMELQHITPLVSTISETIGFGRIGHLKEKMPLHYFIQYLKKILNTNHVNVVNNLDLKVVKTVALCAGSGADFIQHASCADVYITGDIKYHPATETFQTVLIDPGHYYTERPGLEAVQQFFKKLNIKAFIADEIPPWIVA